MSQYTRVLLCGVEIPFLTLVGIIFRMTLAALPSLLLLGALVFALLAVAFST